ncbi:MAG: hypothetical protein ACT4R6_08505 [Gemmatimonadaceae bacterium]
MAVVGGVLAATSAMLRRTQRSAEGDGAKRPRAELVNVPSMHHRAASGSLVYGDTLFGRSGALRVRLLLGDELPAYPALLTRFGERASEAGVRTMFARTDAGDEPFAFVTMLPWRDKLGRQINGYVVGYWPAERRNMPWNYENPEGFIEVTAENQYTQLSTHFSLFQFVTNDQRHVWPKYVVLREELLDKLELVLNDLESAGIRADHVEVLSGFRHPHYNSLGAMEGNMAQHSRHQFGDAADIIIDSDRDGRMDDLNRDGRVDVTDAGVLQRAVERVELRYPELVGGVGVYHAMGPRGPFAHIDVRGERARWTNAKSGGSGRRWRPAWSAPAVKRVQPTGRCSAEGDMAVLCAGLR